MKKIAALAGLYAAAASAGLIFSLLALPLPWIIGPLVLTGLLTATGLSNVRVPTRTRPFGQITVATFVGAHFTPQAFQSLLQTAPLLICVSLYTLAAALLVGAIQRRLFRTDGMTAFLSVVPVSPVEAGVLAEDHGIAPAPIIFAQTMRIALVVTAFPFLLYFADHTSNAVSPPQNDPGFLAFCVTLGGAIAGPLLFKALRLNNPFFLGPLFLAAMLSVLGQPVFEVPQPVLAVAQIVLGTWLGSCFTSDTFKERPRLVSSVLVSTLLLLAICILGAFLAHLVFGAPIPTMVLGFAPGGTTEMVLTAGILGQDVALVTAMHLSRIFLIMLNVHWITRLTDNRRGVP